MAKQPEQVEVTIFRGTYVTGEGSFGPGTAVKVDAEEAARLKALGVVKPDDYKAPEEVQDGNVKITNSEGVNVIGVA